MNTNKLYGITAVASIVVLASIWVIYTPDREPIKAEDSEPVKEEPLTPYENCIAFYLLLKFSADEVEAECEDQYGRTYNETQP